VFARDGTFLGAGEVDVDSVLWPKRLLSLR
jgi:hypothetical protein